MDGAKYAFFAENNGDAKMKKAIFIISILAIILVLSFAISAYLARPSFKLINHTQRDIKEVQVFWRDKTMKLAGIKAGGKEKIHINSEAAAKFIATFADSRIVESGEIYFTSRLNIIVDIYDNEIKLVYDFQRL